MKDKEIDLYNDYCDDIRLSIIDKSRKKKKERLKIYYVDLVIITNENKDICYIQYKSQDETGSMINGKTKFMSFDVWKQKHIQNQREEKLKTLGI
jgi:hypothetical protein